MKNELLTIGPFTLYGYGLMIAVGIFAAYGVLEYRARKQKISSEHIFYAVLWCLLGGGIASKLLFWITEWQEIVENPAFILQTLTDGWVVYGGLIGGVLAGYLYCRVKKLPFLNYFDLLVPSVALAQGFGRIGCFLAGCCYGLETAGPLSVTFTESEFAPNNVPLIPTQIYSSVLDFLHFGILLYLAKHKKADGQVAACYVIFYSVGRFILEFFRGDILRGSVGGLSTSQFIGIFTGIFGAALLVYVSRRAAYGKKKQS